MSTPSVKTLIDEQIAEIERKLAILGMGLPCDQPVSPPPPKLAVATKRGRIVSRLRHEH